jgi:uncharacterized repeat protein (TIGR03803 family)
MFRTFTHCARTAGSLGLVLAILAPLDGAQAAAVKFHSLYAFQNGIDGVHPYGGLIFDKAGNLYGTASSGSPAGVNCNLAYGCGSVFVVTPSGKEKVLHAFQGGSSDGSAPLGGLIADAGGNLYGTTGAGGSFEYGTVFEMTPKGKETILYAFQGGDSDGMEPWGNLVMDSSGNLYGATYSGGGDGCFSMHGCGTAFRLAPGGAETVMHIFQGNSSDGGNPEGGLIIDPAGNLYGTTFMGGASNLGTVFEISPSGAETILHSFAGGSDGANPVAGLVMDVAGDLYGTTAEGGATDDGTVFEITPQGVETVLHTFQGSDGRVPDGLIMDKAGNLYGTAASGGMGACQDSNFCGVVFELTPGGTETILHSSDRRPLGLFPRGNLLMNEKGDLFGTTFVGGTRCAGQVYPSKGCGTVFKLTVK